MALDPYQAKALRAVGRSLLSGVRFAVSSVGEGLGAIRKQGNGSSGGRSSAPSTIGYMQPEMVKLPRGRASSSRHSSGGMSGGGMPRNVREANLTPEMRRRLNSEARIAGRQPRW
jgi:hypothetical protein